MTKKITILLIVLVMLWFSYFYLFQYFLSLFFRGNIALIPFGSVANRDIQLAKTEIERFYGFKVTVLEKRPLPKSAFYKPRNRFDADLLLDYLQQIVPENYDKVVALTNRDIQTSSSGHQNWGILGLAKLWQKPCIVSTFRLRYKGPRKKYEQRISKIINHEVGHTLGLDHCTNSQFCLMQDARGKLRTIDQAKAMLCLECKKSISYTNAFNLNGIFH